MAPTGWSANIVNWSRPRLSSIQMPAALSWKHGRPVVAEVEATEKVYADYQVTATNRGGHSSLPRPDNAIYELTAALNALPLTRFPSN